LPQQFDGPSQSERRWGLQRKRPKDLSNAQPICHLPPSFAKASDGVPQATIIGGLDASRADLNRRSSSTERAGLA